MRTYPGHCSFCYPYLCLFVLLLGSWQLSGQSLKSDSLYAIYQQSANDSIRIEAALELLHVYDGLSPLEATELGFEAQTLIDSALSAGTLDQDFLHQSKMSCLLRRATAYANLGDWDRDLELLLQVLAYAQDIGDRQKECSTLANLGVLHQTLGHGHDAIRYYRRAAKIAEEIGSTYSQAMALGNIGTAVGSFAPDSTLFYYRESIAIMQANEDMQDRMGAMGWMYNNIGAWYANVDQLDSALHYYDLSLEARSSINHKTGLVLIHRDLAQLHAKTGRQDLADQHIETSIRIGEAASLTPYLQYSYLARSQFRENTGNYNGALADYKKFKSLWDSVRDESNSKQLIQQSTRYEYNKQLLADSIEFAKKETIQRLEIEKQEANLTKQRVALGATGGVLVLLLLLVRSIRIGKKRSDELLRNILPAEVADELKQKGEAEARLIEDVTILFTDFAGFTAMAEKLSPRELVADIHEAFTEFDRIADKYGIEKIKTIGDAYMAAGGLPVPNQTHAQDVVKAALEILRVVEEIKRKKIREGQPFFEIRIGVHTGPVVAGIVGIKKFSYDIWGDTVNTAARMESSGAPGRVNISGTTYNAVKDNPEFSFTARGELEAKGKGKLEMWFADMRS